MKKNKIKFDEFEIIKEGKKSIRGGTMAAGTPASEPDWEHPYANLPVACDRLS